MDARGIIQKVPRLSMQSTQSYSTCSDSSSKRKKFSRSCFGFICCASSGSSDSGRVHPSDVEIVGGGGRRKRRASSDSDVSFYSAKSSLTPLHGYGVVQAVPYEDMSSPFAQTDLITLQHPNPLPKGKPNAKLPLERNLSMLSTQANDGDVEDTSERRALSVCSSSASDSRDAHLEGLEVRSARSSEKITRAKAALRQARMFFHRAFC
jgi:hypothetical protein